MIARVAGAAFLLTLTSCYDKNDPSYEKEVLRLTAEKAVLETKLEASEKENKKVTSSLSTLRSEMAKDEQKSSDLTLTKLKKLEAALVKRDEAILQLTQDMAKLKKTSALVAARPTTTPTPPATTPKKNPVVKDKFSKEGIIVNRNGGGSSQPTRTRQQKKQTDPNAHKIDWGKAQ